MFGGAEMNGSILAILPLEQSIARHVEEFGPAETLEVLAEAHNKIAEAMGESLPDHIRVARDLVDMKLGDGGTTA